MHSMTSAEKVMPEDVSTFRRLPLQIYLHHRLLLQDDGAQAMKSHRILLQHILVCGIA